MLSIEAGHLVHDFIFGLTIDDPTTYYNPEAPAAGKLVIFKVSGVASLANTHIGVNGDVVTRPTLFSLQFAYYSFLVSPRLIGLYNGLSRNIGTHTPGETYRGIINLRLNGFFGFIQGATEYPHWSLVDYGDIGVGVYPGIGGQSANYAVDYIGVPAARWLPSPLLSDQFSGIAYSDGLAHPEHTGLGSGGSRLTWDDQFGVTAVGGGTRYFTSLTGFLGISVVNVGKVDVIFEVRPTWAAGNVGIVVRYLNAANFVYILLDGTNITVRQVSGGADTEVVAPVAAPWGAGQILRVAAWGTKFRVWYGEVAYGGDNTNEIVITDPDLQTGTQVGIYTSNIGNVFRKALCYARGTGGEYDLLAAFFASDTPNSFCGIGDSKTYTNYYQNFLAPMLMTTTNNRWEQRPPTVAFPGFTVADMETYLGVYLAAMIGSPEHILINLGTNDISAPPAEAVWKASYQAIITSQHAKWPGAKIYLAKPIKLVAVPPSVPLANCALIHSWIDDLVALYPYVYPGIDETELEGGNGYLTYLADNAHPNYPAGYQKVGQLWETRMGY